MHEPDSVQAQACSLGALEMLTGLVVSVPYETGLANHCCGVLAIAHPMKLARLHQIVEENLARRIAHAEEAGACRSA